MTITQLDTNTATITKNGTSSAQIAYSGLTLAASGTTVFGKVHVSITDGTTTVEKDIILAVTLP